MCLSKRMIDNDLVINLKELTEFIYCRQVKVNGKRIDDPMLELEENVKYDVTIGLRTLKI